MTTLGTYFILRQLRSGYVLYLHAFTVVFNAGSSGWHMDCLDPPLEENPEGSWYCPQCITSPDSAPLPIDQELSEPLLAPELQIDPALQMESEANMKIDPVLRGKSVDSTATFESQLQPLNEEQVRKE